ncbi:uncharacterized protein At2g39795, mitochondrial-like [Nicotiana sylvestris]|uniref:uncharacterized protein At2g39795, mitochondrial-like n=1 Tax=Nicotiana sylvestris TaxID=4096 RepID=UPI00388CDD8D
MDDEGTAVAAATTGRKRSNNGGREATPMVLTSFGQTHPGQQTISLTKEYQGETINDEVHMPDLVTGDDDEDSNDNDDTERVRSISTSPCSYPDADVIDHLAIKDPDAADEQIAYEGPEFSDLDENLQKALNNYLENRGIKPSTTNFLH